MSAVPSKWITRRATLSLRGHSQAGRPRSRRNHPQGVHLARDRPSYCSVVFTPLHRWRRRKGWFLILGVFGVWDRPVADGDLPWAVIGKELKAGQSEVWALAGGRTDRATNHGANETFTPAFRALRAGTWPAGLVPVFVVELEGRTQLRRVPLRGRENFTDPLFFALPPDDEPSAGFLAGRWNLVSASAGGHRHRLAMDLTVLEDRVVGRLDQNSDYRFAFLTGGTWRSNQLALNIEYINDRYILSAADFEGRLSGTWRQEPDGDSGTWEATRAPAGARLPDPAESVPLVEWRRESDGALDYLPGARSPGDGWRRSDRPLCRVWLP